MKSHAFLHRPILALAAALVALAVVILPSLPARADTVKMKDGKVHEGKITVEANDFIKLEVQVSATIKNTMTIPRADIAEIVKAAPDDVALNDLRKQLPAPSLMTAEAYRTMIEKGPKAFLTQFPASRHKPEVEKMLADLSAELDKVERGGLKIDGDWISAQDRKQFEALTESRIRLVSFRRNAAQRSFIGAMRDFEVLEEQYYGTPAFATALGEAKQLLPAFGSLVQQSLGSVAVRNEQWERDKGVLDEVARAQVEAARAQELANFKVANDREKAAGVKWMTINNNDATSLNAALTLIKTELDRIGKFNVESLTQMGEQLVAADKLIAEGKLVEAREAIAKAAAADAEAAKAAGSKGGGSSSSSSRSSKSSKAGSKPGSYIAALNAKIAEAEAATKLAAEQAATAAAGAQAANTVAGSQPAVALQAPGEAAEVAKDGEAAAPKAGGLADLMATGAKAEGEKGKGEPTKDGDADGKSGAKKSASSSKKKAPASDDDEDMAAEDDAGADDAEPVDDGEGGGLSFTLIMQIVAGVMVLVLVVLKVAGIGGKKKEE
ncbi:MAG: hypothetical protein JNK37_13910 [Verrucomicrobiales bacterium]|nr:hypothetical protein [Verrucomicrobiales bacterium]